MLKLLEAKALEQITVRDIAAEADIGYTTFFRHHPTKEALLDDLAAEEIRRLVDLTVPVMDAKSAGAACRALFAYVEEHRALWSTLLTGGAAGTLREALLRIALGIAHTRSQPGAWPPTEIATRLLVGGTIEVLAWWLSRPTRRRSTRQAKILTRIVVAPVLESREQGTRATVRRKGTSPKRRERVSRRR